MRRLVSLAVIALFISSESAFAHQPVTLLNSDTSIGSGPLLVDGTVSFAVRASFKKAGEVRAFRAALKEGDNLNVQYLILDRRPENKYKVNQLPKLTITSPKGKKFVVKLNERTKFFEPFSQTKYLYLSRISQPAENGIYGFEITSNSKAEITIAVGDKEIPGEVIRGALPTPQPSQTKAAAFTMGDVAKNNSPSSCWSAINGNVYNLTDWINSHPGGAGAIQMICGIDGSSAFNGKHRGQGAPAQRLTQYLLGPLTK